MGYYIRILGTSLAVPPLAELQNAVRPATLDDGGVGDEWGSLVLKHESGVEIAVIEKNTVKDGELGAEEIEEFVDEVQHRKPDSAAAWLRDYLPSVKVIYAFQLLSGTDVDNGFDQMHAAWGLLWEYAGGILQADQEGFSNEAGFTILWQFSDHVSGDWNAAVLDTSGRWIQFEMDLGNQSHREAFWRGEVPPGAKLL
jgi:hypothetical protein